MSLTKRTVRSSNAPKNRKLWLAKTSDLTSIPAAVDQVVTADMVMNGAAVFLEYEIVEETSSTNFRRKGFENDSVSYDHLFTGFVTGSDANMASLVELDGERLIAVAERNAGGMKILGEVSKGLICKTAESQDDDDGSGFPLILEQNTYSHPPFGYTGTVAV